MEESKISAAEGEEQKEYKHYYVLVCRYESHEWPSACVPGSEECTGIDWHMRVFSSDTLVIVKDTDKEDRESALKASWETSEPGRAERAKRSRVRFMLE